MLARRMLVFALVLLVVTAISTALAPPRAQVQPPEDATPETTQAAESSTVERTVETADEEPQTIRIQTGDRLRLTVQADELGAVSLRDLGQVKAIAPGSDVTFDVFGTQAGTYPVVLVDEDRTVATVRVVNPQE